MSGFAHTYCSQCGGEFGPGDEGFSHCSDHQRPALTAVQIKGALIADAMDYGRAAADELPKSQQMWLDAIKEKMALLEKHAYAEGRKDQAPAWQPIETAPEDTNVLVATTGGWVDTAFWTDEDGEGRKWWWLVSANKFAEYPIHSNLVPTHWMPLPKHPGEPG